MANVDLLTLIADDKQQISYRPRWNSFTGGVNATILLQQIIYRWVKKGRRPFYKFSRPCGHSAYREGDSWEEELGMSRREFESARTAISARTHGDLDPTALISYWTDATRKTWYALNEALIVEKLSTIYPAEVDNDGAAGIQGKLLMAETYISPNETGELMAETCISANGGNVHYVMAESANSVMAETYISNTKITKEEPSKKEPKTTPQPPTPSGKVGRAGGGHDSISLQLLKGFGVKPRSCRKYAHLPPAVVQARIWQIQQGIREGDRVNDPPGLLIYYLRGDDEEEPPAEYVELAEAWLAMDEEDRAILREAAGGVVDGIYQPPPPNGHGLRYRLPDDFYPDLGTAALHAYLKVMQ